MYSDKDKPNEASRLEPVITSLDCANISPLRLVIIIIVKLESKLIPAVMITQ